MTDFNIQQPRESEHTKCRYESNEWERELIETLATDALKEKRRARYWGIFFKLFFVGYLIAVFWLLMPEDVGFETAVVDQHTALIDLAGPITGDETGVSADTIAQGLRNAFEDAGTQAVILRINSPGGLPVQSSYIQKEILRLREKHSDIPIYSVVSDICASGAYYVASATERIYVNESSIVGSIGVRMDGFGFTEAMQDLGVERRLYTAGEHKGILDPFSPVDAFDRQHAKQMLDALHQTFIDAVKTGRGDKLKDDAKIFSGLVWDGKRSIELGLADAIGSASYVAREVIGHEDIVNFTPEEDPLERLAGRIGVSIGNSLVRLLGLERLPTLE